MRGLAQRQPQRGAVLIFVLIFLLVLTVVGLSSMESTILEERMAGNLQDFNVAFQAAEVAVMAAEQWLASRVFYPQCSADGSSGVWGRDAMDPDPDNFVPWWREPTRDNQGWWAANAVAVTTLPGLAQPPRYIIEEFVVSNVGESVAIGSGEPGRIRVFHRITGRGTGRNAASVVQLQSTYVRVYE